LIDVRAPEPALPHLSFVLKRIITNEMVANHRYWYYLPETSGVIIFYNRYRERFQLLVSEKIFIPPRLAEERFLM